jgi:hypothetical protein
LLLRVTRCERNLYVAPQTRERRKRTSRMTHSARILFSPRTTGKRMIFRDRGFQRAKNISGDSNRRLHFISERVPSNR